MSRKQATAKYKECVEKLLKDDQLPREMIRAMGVMHREAGYGDDIQPLIAAGGIEALVRVAVTGWPAEGHLSSSSHPYDAVVNVRDGPFSMPEIAQQLGMDDGDWASPRRIALDCLADMSNYQPYLQQMARAGFFEPLALPLMLEQSMAHIDYDMHCKDPLKFEYARDQSQAAPVRLLNIAGKAIPQSSQLAAQMADQTGLKVCQSFKDPYAVWVEKAAAAREEVRRKGQQQGWDERRIDDAARALKDKQQAWEEAEYDRQEHFKGGGLNYYFSRFCNTLVQVCSQEQLLMLVHEGGLINKLRGMMPQHTEWNMSFNMMTNGPSGNRYADWGVDEQGTRTEQATEQARARGRGALRRAAPARQRCFHTG